MSHLFKGELSVDQLWHLTYKEIGYLRELRAKRKEKGGGAEEAATALAAMLTVVGGGGGKR